MNVITLLKRLENLGNDTQIKLHDYEGEPLGGIYARKLGKTLSVALIRKERIGEYLDLVSRPEHDKEHAIVAETVGELKEALSAFAGMESVVQTDGILGQEALFVNARLGDDSIAWIDGENDIDMMSEISARFKEAIEDGLDEYDVYADMLEIGIGVDMVRKYMGEEDATHMEEFCKAHGLL